MAWPSGLDPDAAGLYVAGFRTRCGQRVSPALPDDGVVDGLPDRLLVTDDRACERLAALLPDLGEALVVVLAPATACGALLAAAGRPGKAVTAMASRDLSRLPRAGLPPGLALRAVGDGVALERATDLVARAEPGIDPERLAASLRAMPPDHRLWAAIDEDGEVQATSGASCAGGLAKVVLVDVDPAWRGRGIATAMTSHALQDAFRRGARGAWLDASAEAVELYRRLGFAEVGAAAHHRRA